MKFQELMPFLTSRAPPLEMKGRVDASCVRSSMTYGSETRSLLVDVGLKFKRAEMQMIRWMCGISLKDRTTNEELIRLVGVEPITTFMRGGRLRWYGHVMRKGDEDWVKKCLGFRIEGKRPVGRPRKTWLESIEADMAELEIDKEEFHYLRYCSLITKVPDVSMNALQINLKVGLHQGSVLSPLLIAPVIDVVVVCLPYLWTFSDIFTELTIPPQAAGAVGTFKCAFYYI